MLEYFESKKSFFYFFAWIALGGCNVAGSFGGAAPSPEDCVFCVDQDGDGYGDPNTIITDMIEGSCNEPDALPNNVSEDAVWVFGRRFCTDCDDSTDIVFPGNEVCGEEPTPLMNGTLAYDYNCNGKHDHCEMTEGICRINEDATECEYVPGFFPTELTQQKLNDPNNTSCGYFGADEFKFGKALYMTGCDAAIDGEGVVTACTILQDNRTLSCK